MIYNTTHHMMQFCDDTDWIAMAGTSNCGGGGGGGGGGRLFQALYIRLNAISRVSFKMTVAAINSRIIPFSIMKATPAIRLH